MFWVLGLRNMQKRKSKPLFNYDLDELIILLWNAEPFIVHKIYCISITVPPLRIINKPDLVTPLIPLPTDPYNYKINTHWPGITKFKHNRVTLAHTQRALEGLSGLTGGRPQVQGFRGPATERLILKQGRKVKVKGGFAFQLWLGSYLSRALMRKQQRWHRLTFLMRQKKLRPQNDVIMAIVWLGETVAGCGVAALAPDFSQWPRHQARSFIVILIRKTLAASSSSHHN